MIRIYDGLNKYLTRGIHSLNLNQISCLTVDFNLVFQWLRGASRIKKSGLQERRGLPKKYHGNSHVGGAF